LFERSEIRFLAACAEYGGRHLQALTGGGGVAVEQCYYAPPSPPLNTAPTPTVPHRRPEKRPPFDSAETMKKLYTYNMGVD
jgi:hypothetical protein